MKKKGKFLDILRAVAPTIATALGGPLAGIATRTLADQFLGDENAGPEAVETYIEAASSADLVRLREIEAEFKAQMSAAGIELERIAAADRDSARARQVSMRDWTPTALALLIIGGFFGVLAGIFYFGLPDPGGEVLLIMVGALGAMTTQVGNYYFGSSAGSKEKQDIIAKLKGTPA